MKKQINKKHRILLISSAILFSTVVYLMSDSLILGASAGGGGTVSTPGTVPSTDSIQTPASTSQKAQAQQDTNLNEDATSKNKNNEEPKEVYVIKAGQTLWEIAQDSGLSIQTLMNKNQLSSSVIVEGQELVLD